MKINNVYSIGELVYLVSDIEQFERQVIGIYVTPIGLMYEVSCNGESFSCFEIELSKDKRVL